MDIGQFIQGGIYFYTGASFALVALQEDIEQPLTWGCYKTAIGDTSTIVGTGSDNTNYIVAGCTGNTMNAASVCNSYSFSGYTDWFLPSKDELNEMYLVKDLIGGFDINTNYWSSSQNMPQTAWMQFFLEGTQSNLGGKEQLYKVRPIRIMT